MQKPTKGIWRCWRNMPPLQCPFQKLNFLTPLRILFKIMYILT